MAVTNPYTTLGVSQSASADEVKKAFHKLAHQHHPDKKGGDSVKFKEINEAYQILSDPAKRKQYDQYGFAGNGSYSGGQPGAGGYGGGFDGFSSGNFDMGDIFDLFGSAFSGGGFSGEQRQATKGEDIYLEVPVSKKDLGTTKVFEFKAHNFCEHCQGVGVEPGSKLKDCETCKGAGQVRQTARTIFGSFSQVATCPNCRGKRKIPEKKCSQCRGAGRVEGKRKMEIHIPKDITNGYNIVFPKQGNAGMEGKPSGDLLMTLKFK